MSIKTLEHLVADAAPLLGAVLPIPGGAAIGALIATEFGTKANDPEATALAIANDPDAVVKLKTIEANCKVQLQQILSADAANTMMNNTAVVQSDNADRQSARLLVAKSRMPMAVSLLILLGFFLALFWWVI